MRFYALRSGSALLAAQEGGAREGGDAQQRQPQREAGGIAGRGAGLAGFTGTGLIAGIGRAAGGIAVDGRAADVALAVVIGVRVAERRDLARQHVAAGAGAALDAGHRARRGLGDRPLAVIMRVLGADHIGAVADADARERAVGRVEGVVIGRKTRHGDLAADGEVLHILGGGDVAVDEDAGDIAVLVADHDGLNKAVFKLEALDEAAEGDETAEDGAVVHLRGGDLRRDDGLALADLRDGGDLQLQLTLIEVGRAAHADAVADLEVPGDGEAVDAAGAVLNIDAVEEGGILVIAGGVRGDDALDRVLVAGLGLLLHLGDRGDLHGVELLDEVLADAVVGVVLFRVGIFTPYYGVGIRCMA